MKKTPNAPLTLDEIARMAGTSKSTVSRVISKDPRISEKTRVRVQRVIDKQHYRPNFFARALAGGKTGLIGVISSNIGSGFYAEVIRGIDLVFHQDNKRLLVSIAHFENDYDVLWRDLALDGRVEGLILIAPTAEFFTLPLAPPPIPVVVCVGNPPVASPLWRTTDCVGMNNAGAMKGLVEHLAALGCRRLLHAAGWNNNYDAVQRKKGFVSACRQCGIEGEVELFGITTHDGEVAMRKYMESHRTLPDAVIAFNDAIALGIQDAWRQRAGKDKALPFALTGWDDSPLATAIGLSSVSIPFTQLGETSARLLNERMGGKPPAEARNVNIDLDLRLRSSSNIPAGRFSRKK